MSKPENTPDTARVLPTSLPPFQSLTDLGIAWEMVEEVLPEGARLVVGRRPEGTYEAWVQSKDRIALGFAYGDTPTAALGRLIRHISDPSPQEVYDWLTKASDDSSSS